MTVEEIRGCVGGNEIDRFPVGMRVLAVDDDPTCLKLLDGLLRKCQYQVTTTNQAITALKMLRENRNRFDLVISDVHMPDMDGFKLLEQVGLEMDLPVIMLSGNSDPKLVMKGITHGACDYLVKPVRLEELRNIWQHVIRRRKLETKSQTKSNNSNNQDKQNQGSDGGQEAGNGDQNGKFNRKRKDEDEDGEENGHENDDPSSQKKPRVVWSIDLHRKFVAAVNQLGIEKAVPKRILDLMNVEGLTRENVASHLQKYRLYLKRISLQQANMVVAFGGSKDASSYMRMGSLDGVGDFRTLSGSGRLPNAALSSYPHSGMLGRLNSATGVTLHSLTSPSLIQPNNTQNLTNSISSLNKFQPVVSSTLPNQQNTNLFQGIPSSFDLDHLQQSSKQNTQITDFNTIDESRMFTGSSAFMDPSVTVGNQSSLKLASTSSESLNLVLSNSSFLGQSAIQPSKFSSNSLPLSENFHDQLPANNNLRYVYSATGVSGFGSNITTSASVLLEVQSGGLVSDTVQNINPCFSNQNQKRGQYDRQDYTQCSTNAFSTLASLAPANGGCFGGPVSQAKEQVGGIYDRSNGDASTLVECSRYTDKSSMELKMKSGEDYLLEQAKLQGGFLANSGYDSLDDLMNGMMKREQDPAIMVDGEFGFDSYPFGSCL